MRADPTDRWNFFLKCNGGWQILPGEEDGRKEGREEFPTGLGLLSASGIELSFQPAAERSLGIHTYTIKASSVYLPKLCTL